jgi:hypothetical protein
MKLAVMWQASLGVMVFYAIMVKQYKVTPLRQKIGKPDLSKRCFEVLAGAKTWSGQTALKKEVVRSKLKFKFSSHPDKKVP